MSGPPHLVSGGRSHPCVPPLAAGATQHTVANGRCTRCGATVDVVVGPAARGQRGLWLGERVLATAIGSGAIALGAAYMLIATERMRDSAASFLSAPAMVGAGCVTLGGLLVARAIRG